MEAGFARVSITPPLGTRLMGFSARDHEQGCTAIHDDVFVRALYLEQGGEAALIIGYDLCFIGRAEADRYKTEIERELWLVPAQVLMNASHSHVGPAVGRWDYGGYEPPDTRYLDLLGEATLRAARDARRAAEAVTVWAGATQSKLPMNRRRPENGAIAFAPNPEGFVFDALPVCLLKGRDDRPVCLLFSVSCHPSMMAGWEVSAEYPGAATDRLDARLGAPVSFFLQGTGGDAKPSLIGAGLERFRPATWDDVAKAGEMVAGEVAEVLAGGLTRVEPGLRTCLMEVSWPMEAPLSGEGYAAIADDAGAGEVRRWWAQRIVATLARGEQLPSAVKLILQGLRIGEGLRLVALEGEPVAGYGALMERFYGSGITFPLGYSNGEGLYLPTSEMLDEGGYEVGSFWEYGFPARLAQGFEGILTEALEKLREAGIA